MARVLVLFHGRGGEVARLADAVAEGARSVRFAEVDVRLLAPPEAGEGPQGHHRVLDDAAAVAEYDAVVLGGPVRDGAPAAEVRDFLGRLAAGALTDRVGSAFAALAAGRAVADDEPALVATLALMGRLGMILVPPGQGDSPLGAALAADAPASGGDALAAARQQGARVAKVAEWVRHAKGHEQGSGGHHHHHDHGHHHH